MSAKIMASGVLTFILNLVGIIPALVIALDPLFGGTVKTMVVVPVAAFLSSTIPYVGPVMSNFILAVQTSQWVLVAVCGVIWLVIAGITAALEGVKGIIIACGMVGLAVFLLMGPLSFLLVK